MENVDSKEEKNEIIRKQTAFRIDDTDLKGKDLEVAEISKKMTRVNK